MSQNAKNVKHDETSNGHAAQGGNIADLDHGTAALRAIKDYLYKRRAVPADLLNPDTLGPYYELVRRANEISQSAGDVDAYLSSELPKFDDLAKWVYGARREPHHTRDDPTPQASPTVESTSNGQPEMPQGGSGEAGSETTPGAIPCPDALWTGVFEEIAHRLGGVRTWEVWAGALAALSALANRQVECSYYGSALFPMLYILLINPTGTGKKKTADICEALLPDDYNISRNVQSGPALAHVLTDAPHEEGKKVVLQGVPSILIIEEWTTILKNGGIANSTLFDELNNLFQLRGRWNQLRSKGGPVVKDPALTILGTTTNALFRQYVNETHMASGFMNRYLVLPGTRGAWELFGPHAGMDFTGLHGLLKHLRNQPWKGHSIEGALSKGARAMMQAFSQKELEHRMNCDDGSTEALKRAHIHMFAVALLYAWSAGKQQVNESHAFAATSAIRASLAFHAQLMAEPESIQETPYQQVKRIADQRVLQYVRKHQGCTRRDIGRALTGARNLLSSGDIDTSMKNLVSLRVISAKQEKNERGGTIERFYA